jgi:hypothetical protein
MTGVVIYSEERGVYLGTNYGEAIWAGGDMGDNAQESAPVFNDAQHAYDYISMMLISRPGSMPNDAIPVAVVPDGDHHGRPFASPMACMAAGLPGWLTGLTADMHDQFYGERPRMH